MHRPLGRAAFVVHAPFAPPGGGALLSAAWAGGLVLIKKCDSASSCLAHFGCGKMRQTHCVLSLAKILNKKVLFILRRRLPLRSWTRKQFSVGGAKKFLKGVLIFARSSPPIRQKNFIEEKQAAGKPNLSWMQRWLANPHPPKAVFVLGAHPPSTYSPACAKAYFSPKGKINNTWHTVLDCI